MRTKFKNTAIIILIVSASLFSVWPVLVNFSNSLVLGQEDILITWILNQTIQKIPGKLNSIFQANILYPYQNTLAYSVLLLPSAIVSSFLVKLTGNFLLAYNFNLVLGQILTILVCFLWFRDITKDSSASLLASIALGLSDIRMHYFAHLQMWTMYFWLAAAWLFWRFLNYKKSTYLYLAAILAAICVWENPFQVVLLLSVCLFMIIVYPPFKRSSKHLILASITSLALSSPALIVYFSLSRQFAYVRPIREVSHFSMSLNDIFGKNFFSPGLFSLLLLSFLLLEKKTLRNKKDLKWIFLTAIFSFVMALGPVLKFRGNTVKILGNYFIPLPYGIIYYSFPFIQAFRTPSRWIWLFAFASSAVIAVSFATFKSRFKPLFLFFALLIAVIGGTRLKTSKPIPSPSGYPAVYHWLKDQPGFVVLELPAYTWASGETHYQEMYRMLYSLHHKKTLVNGVTGFYPPEWTKLIKELNSNFPEESLVDNLSRIGVDYIIVHKDEYNNHTLNRIYSWGNDKLIWEDDESAVFNLHI